MNCKSHSVGELTSKAAFTLLLSNNCQTVQSIGFGPATPANQQSDSHSPSFRGRPMEAVLCRELVEKGLGEDDLRLLRDAGYVNRERLNLASREGLREAKLLPAVVDIIKSK